jgi:hypothetical protein
MRDGGAAVRSERPVWRRRGGSPYSIAQQPGGTSKPSDEKILL